MESTGVLTLIAIFIFFMFLLSRTSKYFEKLSPKTIKYLDYGSFGIAVVTGLAWSFGKEDSPAKYLFFASVIVYFITLRHSMQKKSSQSD